MLLQLLASVICSCRVGKGVRESHHSDNVARLMGWSTQTASLAPLQAHSACRSEVPSWNVTEVASMAAADDSELQLQVARDACEKVICRLCAGHHCI